MAKKKKEVEVISIPVTDKKILFIGIDQSYHSTGLCLRYSANPAKIKFIQLCDTQFKHSTTVVFKVYNRVWSNTNDFSTDEINRMKSAHNLFIEIKNIIAMHSTTVDEVHVSIEGSVMSGFGAKKLMRLTDILCLNSILKYNFLRLGVKLFIFPPTTVKKRFTGNGRAKKEDMISKFQTIFKDNFDYTGKIDDIVDSYALSTLIYAMNEI